MIETQLLVAVKRQTKLLNRSKLEKESNSKILDLNIQQLLKDLGLSLRKATSLSSQAHPQQLLDPQDQAKVQLYSFLIDFTIQKKAL